MAQIQYQGALHLPDQTLSAFALRAAVPAARPVSRLPSSTEVLPVTMAISVLLHAFVLLLTFKPPEAPAGRFKPQIDVVLVNAQSSSRPVKADALAQVSLDGGGNTEADRRAKSNLPAARNQQPADSVQLAARRVQQLEQEARRLLEVAGSETRAAPLNTPAQQPRSRDKPEDAQLDARQIQIAKLQAQIARDWEAYQKLPRRKFIGARTEGVVYAEYVDKWRQRIERVGTENFPEEARRRGLYGSLLVTVSIRADGSVEKVEIERSSGQPVLDRAALRIVELSGPFPVFPAAIRAEVDVLSITRNWSFLRNDLAITVEQ